MSSNGFLVYPASEAIREALISYFAECNTSDTMISEKEAVTHIRRAVPDCTLTDEYLGNIVVEQAILFGFDIHLDNNVKKQAEASFVNAV